ncbi:MAG: hypothetical protein AAB267_06405 [Candidatus Desantisbacteria bacterium]
MGKIGTVQSLRLLYGVFMECSVRDTACIDMVNALQKLCTPKAMVSIGEGAKQAITKRIEFMGSNRYLRYE